MKLNENQRQELMRAVTVLCSSVWNHKYEVKAHFISRGFTEEKYNYLLQLIESFEDEVVNRPVFESPENHLEQSINAVDQNANEQWKKAYWDCIMAIATKNEYFTSDDIVDRMTLFYPGLKTHENRASGALIKKAKQENICIPTDTKRTSKRPGLHYPANQLTVWKSLLV